MRITVSDDSLFVSVQDSPGKGVELSVHTILENGELTDAIAKVPVGSWDSYHLFYAMNHGAEKLLEGIRGQMPTATSTNRTNGHVRD